MDWSHVICTGLRSSDFTGDIAEATAFFHWMSERCGGLDACIYRLNEILNLPIIGR